VALSSKLVVVVELSARDRNYLRRIADAIAPLEGPGEADIDDTPPGRPYVDHVFEGDKR
jgi:hypothetical protein